MSAIVDNDLWEPTHSYLSMISSHASFEWHLSTWIEKEHPWDHRNVTVLEDIHRGERLFDGIDDFYSFSLRLRNWLVIPV